MAVLRVADADERRQSAQNGVIGAVAKGQMAADELCRRSRIAGADGQQDLALIACRLERAPTSTGPMPRTSTPITTWS